MPTVKSPSFILSKIKSAPMPVTRICERVLALPMDSLSITPTGMLAHTTEYTTAVIEAVADAGTLPNPMPPADARQYAQFFLQRSPVFSNSPVGLSAVAFESRLCEREVGLLKQFIETQVTTGQPSFMALFEGKIEPQQMQALRTAMANICTLKVVTKADALAEGMRADWTVMECTPIPKGEKEKAPEDKKGLTTDATQKVASPMDESVRKEYQGVIDAGGMSDAMFSYWAGMGGKPLFESVANGNNVAEYLDAKNVTWRSYGETWVPVLDEAPPVKEEPKVVESDEASIESPIFAPRSVVSQFSTWAIKGTDSGMRILFSDEAYDVDRPIAEAVEVVKKIYEAYGTPQEADMYLEAAFREYSSEHGTEVEDSTLQESVAENGSLEAERNSVVRRMASLRRVAQGDGQAVHEGEDAKIVAARKQANKGFAKMSNKKAIRALRSGKLGTPVVMRSPEYYGKKDESVAIQIAEASLPAWMAGAPITDLAKYPKSIRFHPVSNTSVIIEGDESEVNSALVQLGLDGIELNELGEDKRPAVPAIPRGSASFTFSSQKDARAALLTLMSIQVPNHLRVKDLGWSRVSISGADDSIKTAMEALKQAHIDYSVNEAGMSDIFIIRAGSPEAANTIAESMEQMPLMVLGVEDNNVFYVPSRLYAQKDAEAVGELLMESGAECARSWRLNEAKDPKVAGDKKKVASALAELGKTYYKDIPFPALKKIITDNGFDAKGMEGIYTGKDGRSNFPIGRGVGINLVWHKMDGGKWEITAYTTQHDGEVDESDEDFELEGSPIEESEVAKTILQQLGGNKFTVMTGAKNYVGSANSLSFKIGKNSSRANGVRIVLNGSDYYDVIFSRFAKVNGVSALTELKKYEDIGAEDLRRIFTEYTGMHTSLGTMGRTNESIDIQPVVSMTR